MTVAPHTELQEICTFLNGGTPSRNVERYFQGDVPWITSADIDDNRITPPRLYITQEAIRSSSTNLVPKGNLLLVTRTGVGKVAITDRDICISQDFTGILLDKSKVDPLYLFHFLSSKQAYFVEQQRGATIQGITREVVGSLKIPLPPLSKQRNIAAILGKADRLRRLRRYAQELTDGFLQSVLVRMFGDPRTNPKGWERGTLADVITSVSDGPHVSPAYTETGIPFLSTRNIRRGELIWDDLKYISRGDAKSFWSRCKPKRGDILYTKGGTTGLAKMVDFDAEIAVWVHIAVLKLKAHRVVPLWLENMLNSDYCYKQSQKLTQGIVNHDLGLTRMPKIELYLPPLKLQERFSDIARRFGSLRAQQREAERQAEHLFQALLQRAFAGKL